MRRPFVAFLCAAFCFLLTTPEYTGIDHRGIVSHQKSEPDVWGIKFIPALVSPDEKDNVPLLVAHLAERYKVDMSLAEQLAAWADSHVHGSMILAIMSVESSFRPNAIGPGGRGLGQINPIHLREDVIRWTRIAGRPTLIDKCGIEHEHHLYDPEMNFCATGTLYGNLLEQRGSAEKALYGYVGSRGSAGREYARKVMRAHANIAGAIQ